MPKKLPKEVVEHWPEVFGDIDVNVIPLDYLASIRITFHDDVVWDVDLDNNVERNSLESMLEDLFYDYSEDIKSLDFRLDTEKVKHDIKKRTSRFLKKRK